MGETNKEIVIERAERKILANIYYIYENLDAKTEIEKIRKKFIIPNNFYSLCVKPLPYFNPNRELDGLLFDCLAVWGHLMSISEKAQNKIIRNLGKKKFESYIRVMKDKKFKGNARANIIVQTFIQYLFIDETRDLHRPLRVNLKVWEKIISAKLFEIPQEAILNGLKNLTHIYFPKIDEKMKIQINELTSIEDIKYIWQEINNQQQKFTKYHNLVHSGDYLNHDRDKLAYELRTIQHKSRDEIKELLTGKGYYAGDKIIYITKLVKAYKKFIGEV